MGTVGYSRDMENYETPIRTAYLFLDWAKDKTYISLNRTAKSPTANLYVMFQEFCALTGRAPMSVEAFGRALGALGYPSVRGPGGARYRGGLDSFFAIRNLRTPQVR